MDLPHTSKLSFLSLEGEPLESPAEWQPALLEVRVPIEHRKEVQLWRQGTRLRIFLQEIKGKERILTDWP